MRKKAGWAMAAGMCALLAMFAGCSNPRSVADDAQPVNSHPVNSGGEPPVFAAEAPRHDVNVLTYHDDEARTGEDLNETMLTPRTVNTKEFGKIGFLAVQGLVDAEPLYVANLMIKGAKRDVVFVATEDDMVYAFDADTFVALWQISLLGPDEKPSDDRGCGQVKPEIGITSTPVIDLKRGAHGTMFVVAMSKDSSGRYFQRLHALDITTGAESEGSPEAIRATFPGTAIPNSNGHVDFDPKQYKERASLLLLNGVVYTSWASHCDFDPYTGWVMANDAATLKQISAINVTPNGSEGAFWMSGAGPAADPQGRIFLLTGNGTFDTTLNAQGFPDKGDYGNAFLEFSAKNGKLGVADYFDMHNTIAESDKDLDLGSGGTLVLPDQRDSSGKIWHLAVGAGKDNAIYLVNRDSMGKFNPQNDSAIYQEIPSTGEDNSQGLGGSGGVYSMPAYFNDTIYYGSVDDSIRAFKIENARIVSPAKSKTAITFGYPGVTPSISANGNRDGIVWAVENNTPAVLHAYDANDLTRELYNSDRNRQRDEITGNKFITPMIANGKVFVGTPSGVAVFGLLAKQAAKVPRE